MTEGSLLAPTRHPLAWKTPEFNDEQALDAELARIFDICHGCRRCVSLCGAFPTLFDLIDNGPTGELDGVPKEKYKDVVDQCYLCDMCYMSKCPYVPPHPWNVDFPHTMLRAKAVHFGKHGASSSDKFLTSTDKVGRFAGIPIVTQTVNAINQSAPARAAMEKLMGVDRNAWRPDFAAKKFRSVCALEPFGAGARWRQDAGQDRDLFDLLRQLQRARDRPRSDRDSRSQRDSVRGGREGSVLRNAQARDRRP